MACGAVYFQSNTLYISVLMLNKFVPSQKGERWVEYYRKYVPNAHLLPFSILIAAFAAMIIFTMRTVMSKRKHIVIFSGAGISAESGISTFRDNGGLWDKYDVKEVATSEAWRNNPELVLRFYNERRKAVLEASPNAAHKAIVELEKKYDVTVITQNVDDLHERAGSKKVIHLHGEIRKSRSTYDPNLIYNIKGWELNPGDRCEQGSQLRPHIVWFGEMVPEMTRAAEITATADVLITVGTSLNVYPAAGLVHAAPKGSKLYVIDPNDVPLNGLENVEVFKDKAGNAMPQIAKALLEGSI